MADSRPIGIFDSGVGGLSVFKEVTKLLPLESTIFFADQKNIPYGTKSKNKIEKLSSSIINFLISKNAKAIVIACNTISCYAIDHLRNNFDIPIIGVVPAVKPAAIISKNGKIAVLATKGTINSKYLNGLLSEFAKDKKILKIPCHGLENAIEKNSNTQVENLLNKYVDKIIKFEADVSVLGCTHYPLIKDKIKAKLPKDYKVIDSSSSIAVRLKEILKDKKLLSDKKIKDVFYTSADVEAFSSVASFYLKTNVQAYKAL